MEYTYYSLMRPVSIGTYPKPGMVKFENWDKRRKDPETGVEAWGKIFYSRRLEEKEAFGYDLYYCGELDTDASDGVYYSKDTSGGEAVGKRVWTDKEKAYFKQYGKQNIKQVVLKLNKGTDADIISRLEGVPNIAGYIKELIRADMQRG